MNVEIKLVDGDTINAEFTEEHYMYCVKEGTLSVLNASIDTASLKDKYSKILIPIVSIAYVGVLSEN